MIICSAPSPEEEAPSLLLLVLRSDSEAAHRSVPEPCLKSNVPIDVSDTK
ncbi:hypothetical protein JOB18_021495 [Solea senegalensis]|uniref:Uncharacterized protein n=1 Tax=Solea senegalensis TaxID=28829 RepID=A0AAV6PK36_SOLSE|nr:hypothetical protein JOB18_021495 [Solea senegalensis]